MKLNTTFPSFADYLEVLKSELAGLGIDFDEFSKRYEVKKAAFVVENKNETTPTFTFSADGEATFLEIKVNKYDSSYIYAYKIPVTLEEFIVGDLYQNDIVNSGAAAILNSRKSIDAMQCRGKKVYEGDIDPILFTKELFSL